MKKSTIYVAYINTDLTEGRGYNIPYAVCKSKTTAIRLGKGKNVQGSDALVKPVDLIEITENTIKKWYAPVKECIYMHLPIKQDIEEDKKEINQKKIIQKAISLGLSEKEILSLKGEI